MEFISSNKVLVNRFKKLCSQFNHYKWAVAWAGDPTRFDLAEVLHNNKEKIEQIVIGLHFFQTSPSFIKQYINNKNVRFVMQTNGTFHSKIYLFYNSGYEWCAVIGSSNFTKSGFHDNEEANILITNEDEGVCFDEISQYISSLWENGKYFTKQELKTYIDSFNFQSRKHDSLKVSSKDIDGNLPSTLEVMSWDDYYNNIMNNSLTIVQGRLELLEKAHKLFASTKSFNSLSENKRKALAGFIKETAEIKLDNDEANWKMFGSNANGIFKHELINSNDIGKALDLIPLFGPISKKQFDKYCKAFSYWKDPLSSATRLLAIKRPDFFVCINSKNIKEISKLISCPASNITLNNYWEKIIMRIHNAKWFLDKTQHTKEEQQVKKYQVAMLDLISCRW